MLIAPAATPDVRDWQRMIQLDLLGLAFAAHAALPFMQQVGGGHVVNVSSVMGRTVWAGSAGYSAAKWASAGSPRPWGGRAWRTTFG